MAKNLRVSSVTLANGATTSATLTLENGRIPLAIEIPSAIAGTTMSFNASSDGATFRSVYYEATQYTVNYGTSRFIQLDRNKLEGVKYIQFVTNASQTAAVTLTAISGE